MDYHKKNKIMKALTNPSVYKELKKNPKFKKELDKVARDAKKFNKVMNLSAALMGFLLGFSNAGKTTKQWKDQNNEFSRKLSSDTKKQIDFYKDVFK